MSSTERRRSSAIESIPSFRISRVTFARSTYSGVGSQARSVTARDSKMPGMPVLALLLLGALVAAAPAQAQNQCLGQIDADAIEQKPGPPLRFGITPGAQTGQFFTGA